MLSAEDKKDYIIRILSALLPGVQIYLFGSKARGDDKSTSDYDLALDFGRKLSIWEISRARDLMDAMSFVEKVDIVDLHSAKPELKDSILKEGIVWTKTS